MAKYASVVRPDVTVVTSVGSEHLRSMKNLEGVRAEKSKMVEKMNRDGLAVLNGDDPHVLWMREKTEASIVTYGFRETNDVMASEFEIDWPHGTRFKLHLSGVSRQVEAPLIGRNMVRSVLAAVAVASALGIELETSLRRLDELTPAPGRLQPLALYNGAWILRDDHKSGIETILTAVETLAQIPAPRKLAVVGDITEESGGVRALYRRIGGELAGIVERLLLVGRHSRSISVGARRAGLPAEAVSDCAKDIFKAAEFLREFLEPGDVVLLKGRFEQRLQRIALSLQGRNVRCKVSSCHIMGLHCESCPALGKGWPAMIRQV
jgi:UDP-N-acetylmuramoyl-tripeptide--D-alanyl-D-alanine ligase